MNSADSEAASGFALIAPTNAREQQFEGWKQLRNAGARGNVEALHWSAAKDFDSCKARFSPTGNYRKICADYYSTLVSAASRYCARGTEQDLRYTLPYRVAIEEQSRGNVATENLWHLINIRHCAKPQEQYPHLVATPFTMMAGKQEEGIRLLTENSRNTAQLALEDAEVALKDSGITQPSH